LSTPLRFWAGSKNRTRVMAVAALSAWPSGALCLPAFGLLVARQKRSALFPHPGPDTPYVTIVRFAPRHHCPILAPSFKIPVALYHACGDCTYSIKRPLPGAASLT